MQDIKLFFIVGRGRSGTSLLQAMLNAHSELVVAREGQFIMMLQAKYAGVRFDPGRILEFNEDLWREPRLENWGMDRAGLKHALLSSGNEVTFPELCRIVYAYHARAQGKDNVVALGDKNPHYSLFVKQLLELFPDSKFIHVCRDHRDNVRSYQNVRFDAGNVSALAYRWRRYNQEILRHSKEHPHRFALLRYEDLVSSPACELERVCSFLCVEYEPTMLAFYENTKQLPGPEWHKNLRRPLDKSILYAWKTTMDGREVAVADYLCADVARSLGYQATRSRSLALFAATRPGVLYGWFMTWLEKRVFALPTWVTAGVIGLYRRLTGSI